MTNVKTIKEDERGSVLIVALIILVLITLMGISVTTTSDIDVQIAKNERSYVQEFYAADSAWREAIEWLDVRAQAPSLKNTALFLSDSTSEHTFNIRNYGDGGSGTTNQNFDPATADGMLGTGANAVNYWYKVAYIDPALDSQSMTGRKAAEFGEDFRQYSFVISSVARSVAANSVPSQRVDVTVTKILPIGE
jgi:Tfp pilus assembly protein PilX